MKLYSHPALYGVDGEVNRFTRFRNNPDVQGANGSTFLNNTEAAGQTPKRFSLTLDTSDSSTGFKVYSNGGVLSGAVTTATGTKTSISIGKRDSAEFLFGHINNFRIYDVTLSAAQASQPRS